MINYLRILFKKLLLCFLIYLGFSDSILHGQNEVSSSVQSGINHDWSIFRGNPQLTGVTVGSLPKNLDLLWTFEAGDGIESTAAISEGTVYVSSLDGFLYAVDLESGKLKWKYQATDEIKSSPSVLNKVVYFGDELGTFHAVDTQTGQQKWSFRTDAGIISSANFAKGRVLFGSYDQHLYCLSAKDGSLIWKFETDSYVNGTPAIVNGNVVIAGCDGYFRVFSVEDGVERNKIELGDYIGASPAIFNNRAYVGTFGNHVLCVDLKSETVLWKYEHPKRKFPFYLNFLQVIF